MPLSVTLWSLLNSAYNDTIYNVYILSENISDHSKNKITQLASDVSSRHSVTFIEMEEIYDKQEQLNEVCGNWPKSAWARIFIPEIMPTVKRALYLDIDMLVCADCSELFTMDMKGAALGAVYERISHDFNKPFGIPEEYPGYFNSGTLLMDLEVFRKDNIARKLLNFAKEHREHLEYPDQDALNGVLYDSVIRLHPRWNWNDIATRRVLNHNEHCTKLIRGATLKEVVEASYYPGIVHFCGRFKPWKYNYHIMRDRYEEALRKSKVEGYNLNEGRTLKLAIRRLTNIPMYALVWRKVRKLMKRFGITQPPPPSTWGSSREIAAKGWSAELYMNN